MRYVNNGGLGSVGFDSCLSARLDGLVAVDRTVFILVDFRWSIKCDVS